MRIVEQMPEDGRRPVEREVRHHAKRLARKPHGGGVSLHDLDPRPAAAKAVRHPGIELDRDHAARGERELGGQASGARAEIEHEVLGAHGGVADELRGQRLRAKEVLATRAARRTRTMCARLGHGPSASAS